MDRSTVDVYEQRVEDYLRRDLKVSPGATAFAERVEPGQVRLDLGCGPGHMTSSLGAPVVAADAAWSMISRGDATGLRVQADLERLPFRTGSLHGTWASKCLHHVPADRLPLALADLHRTMVVGAPLELVVFEGDGTWVSDRADDLPGRMFWDWPRERLLDVVRGAGFADAELTTRAARSGGIVELHVSAQRARSLPDFVGPDLRVLVCGLNPSLVAADAGYGYAGPSNRFWKAAVASGLVSKARDPWHAVLVDRVGMTCMVKRATPRANDLSKDEYRAGAQRLERLVAWLRPQVVLSVGLDGWRTAIDRRAQPGPQPEPFAGAAAYVMPSTSGLNAHAQLSALTDHMRAALELAAS